MAQQDDSKSHVTIVGRISDADKEKVKTVSRGHVVTVGRSERFSSLSGLPATVTLKLSSSSVMRYSSKDAQDIFDTKVVPVCRSFDFVCGVEWDKSNESIILTVDTGKISAEDAGWKVRDALSSKVGIRVLEMSVRR